MLDFLKYNPLNHHFNAYIHEICELFDRFELIDSKLPNFSKFDYSR